MGFDEKEEILIFLGISNGDDFTIFRVRSREVILTKCAFVIALNPVQMWSTIH